MWGPSNCSRVRVWGSWGLRFPDAGVLEYPYVMGTRLLGFEVSGWGSSSVQGFWFSGYIGLSFSGMGLWVKESDRGGSRTFQFFWMLAFWVLRFLDGRVLWLTFPGSESRFPGVGFLEFKMSGWESSLRFLVF